MADLAKMMSQSQLLSAVATQPGKQSECLLVCLCSQVCVGNNTNYSAAQGQAADQVWKLSRVHHSKWSQQSPDLGTLVDAARSPLPCPHQGMESQHAASPNQLSHLTSCHGN